MGSCSLQSSITVLGWAFCTSPLRGSWCISSSLPRLEVCLAPSIVPSVCKYHCTAMPRAASLGSTHRVVDKPYPVQLDLPSTNNICRGCNHTSGDALPLGLTSTETSKEADHIHVLCQTYSHEVWLHKVCLGVLGVSRSVGASLAQQVECHIPGACIGIICGMCAYMHRVPPPVLGYEYG